MAREHNYLGTVAAVVDYILHDSVDATIVITPVVTHRDAPEVPFFHACTCGSKGFKFDQIMGDDSIRQEVVLLALMRRPPLVVHECDDELYAARLCETLWPGDKVTHLRETIEAERAAATDHIPDRRRRRH